MDSQEEEQQAAPAVQYMRMEPLQYQAMIAEITNTLRRELNFANHANEFLDCVTPASRNAGTARNGARRSVRKVSDEEHLSNFKLTIPSFHGQVDHDAYLEWEEEMELVFSYHHYTEAKKIKLATSGFSGQAIHWWDQIASTRRRNGEPQITSWFEMKIVMKKRFAPDYNQFGYVQDRLRQRRSQERPNSRPSSTKWTRQEHLCSKEKAVFQQPATNHFSPICKGKRTNSNLRAVSNESFMCNYRKQIPRRLFVGSAESNKEEKKEVSEASSSPIEATVSRKLFRTEKFSNDSITGKCVLPSSQNDHVLKGTEICRELTPLEPASPSSLVFSLQDFEEDTPEEVPKKVPPARDVESSSDARDVFMTRGGREMSGPLPNSFEGKTSVAEGEFNKDSFSVPSVSVLDETCIGFTNLKPVQPSIKEISLQDHEDKLPEKTPRRLSLDSNLASTTSWVFKSFTQLSIGESRLKFCKNIDVPSPLPSLFVIVTPDEEKQFGLENVKELCVSGFVFDEIIQSYETSKHEMFSRPECSLIAETLDIKFALSPKLIRRTLGQKSIGVDADLMIDECFSNKVLHNLKSVRKGCEILCCRDFWVLTPCDMNSALKENVFGSLPKLDHEFALLEMLFRNMCDLLRAKRMSEFEYVEKVSKLVQSNLFANHYIALIGFCSKEKFCSSESSNARMIYAHMLDGDSRNLNLIFKVLNLENSFVYVCCTFDVVFLVFVKKQIRQVMNFVPRTRRIQGLDKQVDYGPKEHLIKEWCQNRASTGRPQHSYQFGDWIWDHTRQPLLILQGEHIFDHISNVFNLFSCVVDELDLRTNPFKGGGDGTTQTTRPPDVDHGPDTDPDDADQEGGSSTGEEAEDDGRPAAEDGGRVAADGGRSAEDDGRTAAEDDGRMAADDGRSQVQNCSETKVWLGPMTRSRRKAQDQAILSIAKSVAQEDKSPEEPACWFNVFLVCN